MVEIRADKFITIIDQLKDLTKNNQRLMLNNINLKVSGGQAVFLATNSLIIKKIKVDVDTNMELEINFKPFKDVYKNSFIKFTEGQIEYRNKNGYKITLETTEEGKYPDTTRIAEPKEETITFSLAAGEIKKMISGIHKEASIQITVNKKTSTIKYVCEDNNRAEGIILKLFKFREDKEYESN